MQGEDSLFASLGEGQVGLALTGMDLRFVKANATLCSMLGYSEQELLQLSFLDVTHPDDAKSDAQAATRLLGGEIPSYATEKRYVTKSGTTRWAKVTASLVRDSGGGPLYFRAVVQDITEQRVLSDRLLEGESRFRDLVENISDLIWEVDENAVFTYANPKIKELLGYEPEEVYGRTPLDLMPPDEARRLSPTMDAVMTARTPFKGIRAVHLHRDGRRVVVLDTSGVPILGADGRFLGWRGIGRDVTERVRLAERERRHLEAHRTHQSALLSLARSPEVHEGELEAALRTITEAAASVLEVERVGVWWFDEERSRITCADLYQLGSGEHSEGLELAAADFPGYFAALRAEHAIAADDARQDPRTREFSEYLAANGITSMLDVPVRLEGEVVGIVCHEHVGPVRSWSVAEQGFAASLADTVALVRQAAARREVEEEHRRLSVAMAKATDAVFITDADGVIRYVNHAFVASTGYTREEAVGQTARLLKSGRQDAALYRDLWDTLVRGEAWKGELVNRKKDGTLYVANMAIFPVPRAEGKPVSYVAIARDLTQQRELEARLRQSQKMEAIGRLAGGVAHDFNNLLTIVLSAGEFLSEEIEPDDPASKDLDDIIQAAKRAATLTGQLLAFSRQQPVQPRVMDINPIVEEMERMARRLLGEDIDFSTKLADGLWNVRVDPGALHQVLLNLAVNARDAMPQGGKLTVETANRTLTEPYVLRGEFSVPAGDYVMVAVSDNGVGMPEEVQDRIFEPFFTTKAKGKGTGLGLATCYGIVKQAGGYIWVYSEQGQGTTFKIFLPRVLGVSDVRSAAPEPKSLNGTETVLVVEDEDMVRKPTVRALRKYGYDVLEARDGEEALGIIRSREGAVDLLLTDVVMPGLTGGQLAEEATSLLPRLKVLYMSGYSADAIAHRGVLESGVEVLTKPFTPDSLARRVRQVLDEPGE